ncbi:hypothetical protein [Clostridium tertium]|jgi:hypothetical protein|uniref:hypothetical protein n=1 Tax=Clostridium tertium TaxID=1559 RepID=UPI000DCFDC98|nr:hypothetical protein [Clostridium tertium]MBP1868286.1 hypothetical protein [Clostridium tertium]MDB1941354.1 hypothetical protein [Clostridium tertium]MDB1947910.1 hypothetical protein [Clostridium tertium]
MNLVTYLEDHINDLIENSLKQHKVKRIKNQSLLLFSNDQCKVNELGLDNDINTFGNIDIDGDKFIFDLIKEIDSLYKKKEFYSYTSNLKIGGKESLIDTVNIEDLEYKEIIKIFINKLSKQFHSSDIILLNFFFDEEFKTVDNELMALSDDEIKYIQNMNSHLNRLVGIFKELYPGISVVTFEKAIVIDDLKNKTFKFRDDVNQEIIRMINKNINSKKFHGEKIFSSIHPIKYYFEKAKLNNKNKLMIIFSAFSTDEAKYNYISTLKTCDCNKLFILDDFGSKGTYYLGLKGDFNIETSVMALISYIMSKNKILFSNVISIGSSKGGSAAIYYGLKYNFGNIIAGAPQYKIGTYLSDLSISDYALEIFGEISDCNRIKYNNLIRLSANTCTNIYLLTSDGDNQYKKVLKEFEFVSRELNIKLNIDKCEINNHGEISREFPKFLYDKLDLVLNKSLINFNKANKSIILFKNSIRKYLKK